MLHSAHEKKGTEWLWSLKSATATFCVDSLLVAQEEVSCTGRGLGASGAAGGS